MSSILSAEETEECAQLSAEIGRELEKGRDMPDAVFMSRFTPFALPLTLEIHYPHTSNKYSNRAPEGGELLEDAFFNWLADRNIGKGVYEVLFSHSINTNILPAIFESNLFEPGDTVLYCTPIYGMLPLNVTKQGRTAVAICGRAEADYLPEAASIAEALEENPDARALMLVNPGNPTGKCLTREQIDDIAEVIEAHNKKRKAQGKRELFVIADQTFQDMEWAPIEFDWHMNPGMDVSGKKDGILEQPYVVSDATPFTPLIANPYLRHHTITLGNFSKSVSPDMETAFWYGPPELIRPTRPSDGLGHKMKGYATRIFNALAGMHGSEPLFLPPAPTQKQLSLEWGEEQAAAHTEEKLHQEGDAKLNSYTGNSPDKSEKPFRLSEYVAKDLTPSADTIRSRFRQQIDIYKYEYKGLVLELEALNEKMKEKYGDDKDYITWTRPDAGFHLAVSFPGLRGMITTGRENELDFGDRKLETSADLARELLHAKHVVTYPGEMFHIDGEDMMLRLSLNMLDPTPGGGYTKDKFYDGLNRLSDFCLSLKKPREIPFRDAESRSWQR